MSADAAAVLRKKIAGVEKLLRKESHTEEAAWYAARLAALKAELAALLSGEAS